MTREDAGTSRQRFDDYADDYQTSVNSAIGASGETVRYFADLKASLVAAVVGTRKALDVLDFGCGAGLGSAALARALGPSSRVTGADPSASCIRNARANALDVAAFQLLEADALPFDHGSFDIVVAACVFHHIDRVQHPVHLAELARVLRPGGTLWVFEHNPCNPLTRHVVRACEFDEGVTLLEPGYTRRIIRAAGLSASRPYYYFFFPRALSALRVFDRSLRHFFLGGQYYITGAKT